jgi:hypothetical protein
MDVTDIKYDVCKVWIKDQRERLRKDWNTILTTRKNSIEELKRFLDNKTDEEGWPEFKIENNCNDKVQEPGQELNEWRDLVLFMKNAEESTARILYLQGQATIQGTDDNENSAVFSPTDDRTAWQCYLNKLKKNGFAEESIDAISHATLKVLRQLSADTSNTDARKGLVIGNVQSGKTANMAALMAMAADWGYNMFIVLSGTIEALRKQTQERLYRDLNNEGCNLRWRSLEHLRKGMPPGDRLQDLDFSDSSFQRHFTVCLKNSTRLKNLIQWLQQDPNKQRKLRVIVIDDEADQAGINTADVLNNEEPKRINALITNLVNGKTWDGKVSVGHYQAMNYIGYTATPYANVLNEIAIESLFPKDFISTLAVSKEYFGPQQIFGYNAGDSCYFEGLNIIREVDTKDVDDIKSIHSGNSTNIPKSLKDAICWFMCCVACARSWRLKKPISLLVHTSQKINHHSNIANAISTWITNSQDTDIIDYCKKIWEQETNLFSKKLFREQYPNYAQNDDNIKDYPPFDTLLPELAQLIAGERLSFIKLGDENERIYHKHIHLCIDNCARKDATDDDYVRLAYPNEKQLTALDYAPAFIVVGGATLSRGLTIEGLTSTYFLRSVGQADTLMQMGRWFGYRRGYELLPRIYLTTKARKQFEFLAELDQELRDEIHTMEVKGQSPTEYGVRVKNSPKVSFIKITANNKQQLAEPATWEFGGSMKQTFLFDNDEKILKSNLNLTKYFLAKLGTPVPQKSCNAHASHAIVWKDKPFDGAIKEFLGLYKFQERLGVFNDLVPFFDWIERATQKDAINNWSVILAGTNNESRNIWEASNDIKIRKVFRNQKTTNKVEGILNIGTLRTATDSLADIDLEKGNDELKNRVKNAVSKDVNDIRLLANMDKVPQLIIYIIDKDSKARTSSKAREDLNAVEDIVGICINIPGDDRSNNVGTVAIDVKKYFGSTFDGDTDVDDSEDNE